MNLPIKIKKLKETARLPERGSAEAAGYDVFACINDTIELLPHTTEKIGTGLAFELPVANCTGVIDSDYRGEVIVALHNDSNLTRYIRPQEKIAQLIVLPAIEWNIEEKNELDETERGSGGFGSTGK